MNQLRQQPSHEGNATAVETPLTKIPEETESTVEGEDGEEDGHDDEEDNLEEEQVDDKEEEEESGCEVVWGEGEITSREVKVPTPSTPIPLKTKTSSSSTLFSRSRVLTRNELLFILTSLSEHLELEPQARHAGRVCVGLIGYPNVGKSSVINTILQVSKSSHGRTTRLKAFLKNPSPFILCLLFSLFLFIALLPHQHSYLSFSQSLGTVRVGVSSTPGKTKHFQTLVVNDALMLCDCPGLVFPSFMRSRGEMLCAGILPINHMKDYAEPAQVY